MLDLYRREGLRPRKPSLEGLSVILRRTEASVRMKLFNFRALDGDGGLRNTTALDALVWKEFENQSERLAEAAAHIADSLAASRARDERDVTVPWIEVRDR